MIRGRRKLEGRLLALSVSLALITFAVPSVHTKSGYANEVTNDQNESAPDRFSRENKTTFDSTLVTGSFTFQNDVLFRGTLKKATASTRSSEDIAAEIAVFRRDGLTMRAWRRSDRDKFFANIENGLEQGKSDYKRRRFTSGRIEGIPYLDIEFTYRAKDRSAKPIRRMRRSGYVRFLLFRRFAMVAVVDGTNRGRSKRKRFVKSFVPRLSSSEIDDES